ncbi:MAG: HAD family phosphatase [Oligoflexia bacterium]|nr:HAD family phosphatase [Oligoflexia bacterium]MBF0365162.1 HAD family phosphatase [Oligoflexia bacterium]
MSLKKFSVKLVIFDLDGVLWNSSSIHRASFQHALSSLPNGGSDFDYLSYAGMGTDEAMAKYFETLAEKLKITLTYEDAMKYARKKQAYAHQLLKEAPPLAAGLKEVLLDFKTKGIKMSIASSAKRNNVDLFMRVSGTKEQFASTLSRDEIKTPKPSPALFLESLRLNNESAEDAVVIEDAYHGVLAAKSAKIAVVAVVGTHTRQQLEEMDPRPDMIVDTFCELQNLINFRY